MQRNGVDTDRLAEFAARVDGDPEAGKVTIRSRHRWDGGFVLHWEGEELAIGAARSARPHRLWVDMPGETAGSDAAPTPGELLHAALGACIAQQFLGTAALAGVDIQDLEVSCVSTSDARGALGIAGAQPRPSALRVTLRVRSAADDAQLEELLRTAVATSPIRDALTGGVPVESELDRPA